MKIAVVQLSDIHLRNPDDTVLKRADHIASAVMSVAPHPDAYLLAVTGDVAFSGKDHEYALARPFFGEVSQIIQRSGQPFFQFLVPGNHDLDFTSEPDTRGLLLETLPDRVNNIDPKGETVRQILSVQENFFEFEAGMLLSAQCPIRAWLARSHEFQILGKSVRVNCFNTAWVSTNPERPGQLAFPAPTGDSDPSSSELVISAFHHPYNWLTPEIGRAFRHYIENTSDVIMTGHEHEPSVYMKQTSDSITSHYIEGAVLQGSSNESSAFNVVLIDTVDRTYEHVICKWTGELYDQSVIGIRPFVRNRLASMFIFRNNSEFLNRVSDPGLPILHPLKHEIKLEDLYLYPALAQKNPDQKFEVLKVIESQGVVEYIRSSPRVLICGDELIGKSSFARKLYCDLQNGGDFVPLLLAGSQFDGLKEKDVRKVITRALVDQYDEESVDRFFRLDHSQRTAIIDDWNEVKYAGKGRLRVLSHLRSFFGKIIIFTSRLYAFEELAETGPVRDAFADFQFCDIKEFGRRLTGKLIEKWHSLGREESIDNREYNYLVASSEQKISALIGKGILPTYPIFLLGLLQADTPQSAATQNAGSYGHVLESVITTRLSAVSRHSTNIGMLYTYASRIAYSVSKKDRPFLSSKELHDLHEEYCHEYQMKPSETKVIADLINAMILCKDGDSYRFRYKGCYCYFVARYFSENMPAREEQLRAELNEMTDRLGWEDYSNIVIFYLYLTRDRKIIDRLLENAAHIYEEWDMSDLEADVKFVNRLLKERPKRILLPSTDIEDNRDRYRTQQDEAANAISKEDEAAPNRRVPYDPKLDEITKLTIAFQNIRVMGQVLRNFPGVLTGEPKYRLAEGCYLLGLRALRRLLALAEQQLEELRTAFAMVFREQHPLATAEEVENNADQKLIWLTGAVSYGMIKRISNSVGLEDLELTFETVRRKLGEKPSIRLVDLGIQLEYFREAPEAEIYDLEKDVQKNPFAYKLLRDLVSEFLYLHNTDRKVFQRLGALFEIEASKPRFLLSKGIGD